MENFLRQMLIFISPFTMTTSKKIEKEIQCEKKKMLEKVKNLHLEAQ